jgi:hypothetical protein
MGQIQTRSSNISVYILILNIVLNIIVFIVPIIFINILFAQKINIRKIVVNFFFIKIN